MASVNKVFLVGHLGQDPELRRTPAGKSVCSFSLATSESWVDKTSNERVERTEWHKIIVWDKAAENCHKFLTKGAQAHIEGRIQTRKWQDKEGRDRYTTEIQAERVTFLSSKGGGASGGGAANQPAEQDEVGW